MERVTLDQTNFDSVVAQAALVLGRGGVILYPTDTLYGLGADAFSGDAVAKIDIIKDRAEQKPIHAIVADLGTAERYADFNDDARALAKNFWPGPLTLVLKKKAGLHTGIAFGHERIGLRIPDNDFCLALAGVFGKPYTTTSANKTGAPQPRSIDEILVQLGEGAKLIDLVVDAGPLWPEGESAPLPSTVVALPLEEVQLTSRVGQKTVSGVPEILRQGAIPADEILNAIPS